VSLPPGDPKNPCPAVTFNISWQKSQDAQGRDTIQFTITPSGSSPDNPTYTFQSFQNDRHATSG
jgi:hypothetical protein